MQHLLRQVAQAVAGGLAAGQGAAEGQALAGKDAAIEAVTDALILAEQVADLPATHADVPGGDVHELADVPLKLRHEALAEAHDLPVALALGVEVGAALAAAHGQAGEAVLQNLLEAQKFQDGQVHRRMEPQAALVGADGGVELHPVAPVHPDAAGIIHPRDTEGHHTLRLHEPLQQGGLPVLRVAVDHQIQTLQHLPHGLMKLLLFGIPCCQIAVNLLQINAFQHDIRPFPRRFCFNMFIRIRGNAGMCNVKIP